jgi:hypothetical protein
MPNLVFSALAAMRSRATFSSLEIVRRAWADILRRVSMAPPPAVCRKPAFKDRNAVKNGGSHRVRDDKSGFDRFAKAHSSARITPLGIGDCKAKIAAST